MQEAFFQSKIDEERVNVHHQRLYSDTASMWELASTVCCRLMGAFSALPMRFTLTLLQSHQTKVFMQSPIALKNR